MLNLRSIFLFLFLQLNIVGLIHAQSPANDNCNNAQALNISNQGFGLGTVSSSYISMDNATTQLNEPFSATLISNGNDKTSVWFTFTLATTRKVTITLTQQGNTISSNDCGFTLYNSGNCFPNLSDISNELKPISKLGSSSGQCLLAGSYMVQVSSKQNIKGNIKIDVKVEKTLEPYDQLSNAYDFSILNTASKKIEFTAGCFSLDQASEKNCTTLGSSAKDFEQSAWFVFETDKLIDYFGMRIEPTDNSWQGIPNSDIGFSLYEGNGKTNPNGLKLVGSCEKMEKSGNVRLADYFCELKPNQKYTIKLLFHKLNIEKMSLTLHQLGDEKTKSPKPTKSSMNSASIINNLNSLSNGLSTKDYFSCNGLMSIAGCGQVNSTKGIKYNGATYDIATWYTFYISKLTKLNITTNDNQILLRLFNGELDNNNCNKLQNSDLLEEKERNLTVDCIEKGWYSLQILGRSNLSNVLDPNQSEFGRPFDLTIKAIDVNLVNQFSLINPNAYDNINNGNGLNLGTFYPSKTDTFSCEATVLPDKTCNAAKDRVIYRTFKLKTNSTSPDSGYLQIFDTKSSFHYQLYEGNAASLATSQNKTQSNQTITGLNPYNDCQKTKEYGYCLKAGEYSFLTFGDKSKLNQTDSLNFRMEIKAAKYNTPNKAENLGDISNQKDTTPLASDIDYFECTDNISQIADLSVCSNANKVAFREFYISKEKIIQISTGGNANTQLSLYKGRANSLSTSSEIWFDDINKQWSCFGKLKSPKCEPLQPGWYTILSMGSGSNFQNPFYGDGDVTNDTNQVIIEFFPFYPDPRYNRPQRAAQVNNGLALDPPANADYPNAFKTYIGQKEFFNCEADTPFINHPISSCNPKYNRTTYYVFKIDQTSFVRIDNIPSTLFTSRVYTGNIRSNSKGYDTLKPIQECLNKDGFIQLCELPKGEYTLVVYTDNAAIGDTLRPKFHVASVNKSRFDYASSAYDFGLIPKNNTWVNGKTNDNHPTHSNRASSNDFFYCNTGAYPSDPDDYLCSEEINQSIYDSILPLYFNNTSSNRPRRNLWYTFTLEATGKATIRVNIVTPDKNQTTAQPYFTIYESDKNGNLTFAQLQNQGKIDSTIAQGLTAISSNTRINNCTTPASEISIIKDECEGYFRKRYYIVVDQNYKSFDYPNTQIEVEIKYKTATKEKPAYDYFVNANEIGSNLSKEPYPNKILKAGQHKGAQGSLICASKTNNEQNSCGDWTIWYKFKVDKEYDIRLGTYLDGASNTYFHGGDILLYKQVKPNDSSSSSLIPVSVITRNINSSQWGQGCIDSGIYYIQVVSCNLDIEKIVPIIDLLERKGDICSQTESMTLNSNSSSSLTSIISCHSIGNGYGEDGSNIGCLSSPSLSKSTYFKIILTDTTKQDLRITFKQNTQYNGNLFQYRLLYGDCDALSPGPCNADVSVDYDFNCLGKGTYFIQLFSPIDALGEVTIEAFTSPSTDTFCNPINTDNPVANFYYTYNCSNDSIYLINLSSAGDSIRYTWNMPDFNRIDTSKNPLIVTKRKTSTQTFVVKLKVENIKNNLLDSITLPVRFFPVPDKILGPDTVLCPGTELTLDASYIGIGNIYLWDDSTINRFKTIDSSGFYSVRVNTDSCLVFDTIYIRDVVGPKADFNDTVLCQNIESALFNFSTVDSGGLSYRWSINSDEISTDTNFTINFTDSGIKSIKLEVISNFNCIDSLRKNINIAATPLVHFKVENTCLGDTHQFFNYSTNNPYALNYQWQMDDSLLANNQKDQVYYFADTGKHLAKLRAENQYGCIDSFSKIVFVNRLPNIAFSINDSIQCLSTNSIFVADSSTVDSANIVQWNWDFGDGTTKSSKNATHSYVSEGSYTLNLTVTSDSSCSESKNINVFVNSLPKPIISFDNSAQCLTQNKFEFNGLSSSSQDGQITKYYWIHANDTLHDSIAFYSFQNTGQQEMKLIVETEFGCQDSAKSTVTLLPPTIVEIRSNNAKQCLKGNNFTFLNNSAEFGNNTSYQWFFGDGDSSLSPIGRHTYSDSGIFYVSLTAKNDAGCRDTIILPVHIFPHPKAEFSIPDSLMCTNESTIPFQNLSIEPQGYKTNFRWNFNGSATDTLINPIFTFPIQGIYKPELIASTEDGCKDTFTRYVYIKVQPKVDFIINDSIQCLRNNEFKLTNTSRTEEEIMQHTWIFENTVSQNSYNASQKFNTAGLKSIKLRVSNGIYCHDSLEKKVSVRSTPRAIMSINDSAQCIQINSFVYKDSTNYTEDPYSINWSFGDANAAIGSSVTHKYQTVGFYTVKMFLETIEGCKDSTSQIVETIAQPNPSFTILDSFYCTYDDNIPLVPSTTGGIFSGANIENDMLYIDTQRINSRVRYIVERRGCYDTSDQYYSVYDEPTLNLGLDTSLCKGGSITLDAQFFDGEYRWSNGSLEPKIVVKDDGFYEVELLHRCGNLKDGIYVYYLDEYCDLHIPNAFSPNGNNLNEYFIPVVRDENVILSNFSIYNRWGEKIQEINLSDNPLGWDGNTEDGEECQSGIYTWLLNYQRYISDTHIENIHTEGVVHLLR